MFGDPETTTPVPQGTLCTSPTLCAFKLFIYVLDEPETENEVGQWGHVLEPVSPGALIACKLFMYVFGEPDVWTETHVWGQESQQQAHVPILISFVRVIAGIISPKINSKGLLCVLLLLSPLFFQKDPLISLLSL